eukprot:IDg22148t1
MRGPSEVVTCESQPTKEPAITILIEGSSKLHGHSNWDLIRVAWAAIELTRLLVVARGIQWKCL